VAGTLSGGFHRAPFDHPAILAWDSVWVDELGDSVEVAIPRPGRWRELARLGISFSRAPVPEWLRKLLRRRTKVRIAAVKTVGIPDIHAWLSALTVDDLTLALHGGVR